jgi:hypothetical protein
MSLDVKEERSDGQVARAMVAFEVTGPCASSYEGWGFCPDSHGLNQRM